MGCCCLVVVVVVLLFSSSMVDGTILGCWHLVFVLWLVVPMQTNFGLIYERQMPPYYDLYIFSILQYLPYGQ